ncbi:uncharacterized protein LOC131231112 [Magnolia sinica]|uniref:uncharacterized protein LOC131231112 n=1 Tax=Magnolia sinica TaxID=86752 RepID=UPI002659EC4F|nr:uncharacterized protein LOC131231112 [Magnolia sinica]
MMAVTEEAMVRWGTWEELVLGGAVLRHGTRAWEAVASELRARTLYAYGFTPKECEAKYEDLQERYCGCTAWFEELRKQRVAELKRELERSEDSIGSLQSKLESLISQRECNSNIDCDTDSTVPTQNADGIECPSKQSSKDGLSAGSFTEDATRDWSMPESQVPVVGSMEENETKLEEPQLEGEKVGDRATEIRRGPVRKRRGKRKRKGCEVVKEGSVEESDVLSSANAVKDKEGSLEGCDRIVGHSCEGSGREDVDLAGILNSIMENEDVLIFRRRIESQKRARYRKMIRRHVDLATIQSSIGDGTISTTKELYRDLLLLSYNALLFYPNTSSEYKSALALRDSTTRRFRPLPPKDSAASSNVLLAAAAAETVRNPVKPRSMRPCNRKLPGKAVAGDGKPAGSLTTGSGKGSGGELPAESTAKKGIGRPAKRGQEVARKPTEIVVRGRKRARRR